MWRKISTNSWRSCQSLEAIPLSFVGNSPVHTNRLPLPGNNVITRSCWVNVLWSLAHISGSAAWSRFSSSKRQLCSNSSQVIWQTRTESISSMLEYWSSHLCQKALTCGPWYCAIISMPKISWMMHWHLVALVSWPLLSSVILSGPLDGSSSWNNPHQIWLEIGGTPPWRPCKKIQAGQTASQLRRAQHLLEMFPMFEIAIRSGKE